MSTDDASGRRILRVGLTGGIGSGKSSVAQRLGRRGAVLVDSDTLAREVVAPGTSGLAAVVTEFGTDVLAADGSLDRPRLGRLVFADPDARLRLERVVHPLVRARARQIEASAPDGSVVVHDIPLLVETGQQRSFDVVVVVDVAEDVQVARLASSRGMSEQDARARITAQATREERLEAADLVVDNAGDESALDTLVDGLWTELQARV